MQDTLSTLTPATPRDDAIAFDLRYASRLMTAAMAKGVASEEAHNVLRADALNSLHAVAVSLDRRTLTQGMIETARQGDGGDRSALVPAAAACILLGQMLTAAGQIRMRAVSTVSFFFSASGN